MTSLTEKETEALTALREAAEAVSTRSGVEWGSVYLDSAKPESWAGPTWAGVLGSLEKKGFYKPLDAHFGDVNLGAAA